MPALRDFRTGRRGGARRDSSPPGKDGRLASQSFASARASRAHITTCGTYLKQQHFQSSERLRLLCETLQRLATKYGWNLQAWAVFSNHYHFVGLSPQDPVRLRTLVSELHTETSTALNEADHTPGS